MIPCNNVLLNLYNLSQTFNVETIEFISINGIIGKYDYLIDIVKKNKSMILYMEKIF